MKYLSIALLALVLFAFLFAQLLVLWHVSDISRRQVEAGPCNADRIAAVVASKEVQTRSSYLYLGNERALCRSNLNGITRKLFVSTLDKGMMPAICNNGDSLFTGWEWEMEKYYLGAIPHGGTIIEMGSNIGYFTQMFGQRFNTKHIIGIEANPLVFELLSSGMDASFSRNQWTTVNVVLAPDGGKATARFCVRPDRPLNGFVVLSDTPDQDCLGQEPGARIETLSARTASSFFTLDLLKYSLVKVDVDWAEGVVWESLAAMMRSQSQLLPLVTVELNPGRNRHMTMLQILESMEALYGEVGMVKGSRCVKVPIRDPQWTVPDDKIACLRSHTKR